MQKWLIDILSGEIHSSDSADKMLDMGKTAENAQRIELIICQ